MGRILRGPNSARDAPPRSVDVDAVRKDHQVRDGRCFRRWREEALDTGAVFQGRSQLLRWRFGCSRTHHRRAARRGMPCAPVASELLGRCPHYPPTTRIPEVNHVVESDRDGPDGVGAGLNVVCVEWIVRSNYGFHFEQGRSRISREVEHEVLAKGGAKSRCGLGSVTELQRCATSRGGPVPSRSRQPNFGKASHAVWIHEKAPCSISAIMWPRRQRPVASPPSKSSGRAPPNDGLGIASHAAIRASGLSPSLVTRTTNGRSATAGS